MPVFDPPRVVSLLDYLYKMDEASRVAYNHAVMTPLSACFLHEGLARAVHMRRMRSHIAQIRSRVLV